MAAGSWIKQQVAEAKGSARGKARAALAVVCLLIFATFFVSECVRLAKNGATSYWVSENPYVESDFEAMIYPNYTICATMMIAENQQKESSIDSLSCRYVNGDQLSAGGGDGDVGSTQPPVSLDVPQTPVTVMVRDGNGTPNDLSCAQFAPTATMSSDAADAYAHINCDAATNDSILISFQTPGWDPPGDFYGWTVLANNKQHGLILTHIVSLPNHGSPSFFYEVDAQALGNIYDSLYTINFSFRFSPYTGTNTYYKELDLLPFWEFSSQLVTAAILIYISFRIIFACCCVPFFPPEPISRTTSTYDQL